MTDDIPESWGQYRKLILHELELLREESKTIRGKMEEFRNNDIAEIKTDITLLKYKASLWGGLVGSLSSIVVTLLGQLLLRMFVK